MITMRHVLLLPAILGVIVLADSDTPSYTTECVQINGTLSLNVTYLVADEQTLDTFAINISKNAKASSFCSDSFTNITLTEGGRDLVIEFTVNLNDSASIGDIKFNQWGVSKISYSYSVEEATAFIKGARNAEVEGSFFVSPVNKSYSCSKEKVELTNVTVRDNGSIVIMKNEAVILNESHLAIRIGNVSPKSPYDYYYCVADQKIKDIVPIAVGVALAALVVIVLVSYLIGRRRTVSAGGYERV